MPKQIFTEPDKRCLNSDAAIWRYVPLRTLFFYLNGLVFIPSIATLREADPFEGEFYEDIAWFNKAFDDHYGDQANKLMQWISKNLCSDSERDYIKINKGNAAAEVFRKRYFEFVRKTRFAWCWFHSYRESAAMWSAYGKQGVAVKTSVQRLVAALGATDRSFVFGRMTYVDYRTGVSGEFIPERESDYHLLLRPFFLKRMEYESECEVRFVTVAPENHDNRGITLRNINPKKWISAIRLWPRVTSDEEESLQNAVSKMLPDADCSKSDLFTGPNSRINDFIHEVSKAMVEPKWHSMQDGIPTELKEP